MTKTREEFRTEAVINILTQVNLITDDNERFAYISGMLLLIHDFCKEKYIAEGKRIAVETLPNLRHCDTEVQEAIAERIQELLPNDGEDDYKM